MRIRSVRMALAASLLSGTAIAAEGPRTATPLPPSPGPAVTAPLRPDAVAAPDPVPAPPSASSAAGQPDGTMREVFSARGGDVPAAIRAFGEAGIEITSLGEAGGARSYLGRAPNGRYQVFYAAPDGDHVVAGIMFRSGGANVTTRQVGDMVHRFAEAAASMPGTDMAPFAHLDADAPAPAASTDATMLDWLRSKGMTVTPFGSREGGLDAYMVVSPPAGPDGKGKLQAFYVMPDPHYAVAGMMMGRNLENVTGLQLGKAKFEVQAADQARAQPTASAVRPGIDPAARPDTAAAKAAADTSRDAAGPAPTPDPRTAPAPQAAPAQVPRPTALPEPAAPQVSPGPGPAASARFRSNIDVAALMEGFTTSVWFQVGAADAPVLYMVVDPQCPFCHAAWAKLKPLVFARKLNVRVVMIAGIKGSDPLARSILTRDNPSTAWLDGEGSIEGVPVRQGPLPGSPNFDRAGRMLQVNANFVNRFNINRTPFMAYVADDGALYSSIGLPDDLDAFLAARR